MIDIKLQRDEETLSGVFGVDLDKMECHIQSNWDGKAVVDNIQATISDDKLTDSEKVFLIFTAGRRMGGVEAMEPIDGLIKALAGVGKGITATIIAVPESNGGQEDQPDFPEYINDVVH
jgi:hypothetical protein